MTVRAISDLFWANLHLFGGLAGCLSSCSPNCLAVANRAGVLDVLVDGAGAFGADGGGSAVAKLLAHRGPPHSSVRSTVAMTCWLGGSAETSGSRSWSISLARANIVNAPSSPTSPQVR